MVVQHVAALKRVLGVELDLRDGVICGRKHERLAERVRVRGARAVERRAVRTHRAHTRVVLLCGGGGRPVGLDVVQVHQRAEHGHVQAISAQPVRVRLLRDALGRGSRAGARDAAVRARQARPVAGCILVGVGWAGVAPNAGVRLEPGAAHARVERHAARGRRLAGRACKAARALRMLSLERAVFGSSTLYALSRLVLVLARLASRCDRPPGAGLHDPRFGQKHGGRGKVLAALVRKVCRLRVQQQRVFAVHVVKIVAGAVDRERPRVLMHVLREAVRHKRLPPAQAALLPRLGLDVGPVFRKVVHVPRVEIATRRLAAHVPPLPVVFLLRWICDMWIRSGVRVVEALPVRGP